MSWIELPSCVEDFPDEVRLEAYQYFVQWRQYHKEVTRADTLAARLTRTLRTVFVQRSVTSPRQLLECVFETASVYGTITDAMDYAKPSFGNLLRVRPLTEEQKERCFNGPSRDMNRRLKAVILDTNAIRKKQITRNEYKYLVGTGLVAKAMKNSLKATYRKLPAKSALDIHLQGKQLTSATGTVYECLVNGKQCSLGFLDLVTPDEIARLQMLDRTPTEFWRDLRQGNTEHLLPRVRNSSARKRAKAGGRVALLDLDFDDEAPTLY